MNVAASLLEALDKIEYFVRLSLLPFVSRSVVIVIVKQLGVGVSLMGPLKGLTDEVIDLVPNAVSDIFILFITYGLVDDVPCKRPWIELRHRLLDVLLKEGFDHFRIFFIDDKVRLVVALTYVGPASVMSSECHLILFSKINKLLAL